MAQAKERKGARNWFRGENRQVPAERGKSANLPAYPASYFAPLSHFFDDMDRMFEQTFRQFGFPLASAAGLWEMQAFRPNIDIAVNDNEYKITAEMPGMDEKDIRLSVSADGTLSISGEKRQEREESRDEDSVCTECSYGAFERTLTLPEDANPENIEARFKNGLLTITCPREENARAQRRRIPIQGGRGSQGGQEERGSGGQKKAA